jgi:hypothetical protein
MGDTERGRNYGYKPDKYDQNDITYVYEGQNKKPLEVTSVNLWKDFEKWLTPVYNQYGSNSCTANATAAALRFVAKKSGWGHESVENPSRLFIYYHARALEKMEAALKDEKQRAKLDWPENVTDEGVSIRYALRSLQLAGSTPEYAQPFITGEEPSPKLFKLIVLGPKDVVLSTNDRPLDLAYDKAKDLGAFQYCRLDPDHPPLEVDELSKDQRRDIGTLTLQRLKQSLVEGYPVIFGHGFYQSQLLAFDTTALNQNQPYPTLKPIPTTLREEKPKDWKHGLHTILAVGFQHGTKDPSTGKVLVQNSWGTENDIIVNYHHYWIPYEYITNYWASSDFWMIRPLTKKPGAPGLKLNLQFPKIPAVNPHPPWTTNILETTNENWAMETTSTIATVVRSPKHVELAWISAQGTIKTARLTDKGNTTNTAVAKSVAAPGAIAAAIVNSTTFDLYWITPKSDVQGWRWSETDKKVNTSPTFTISKDTASPGGGIAALGSADGGPVGVWWVGKGGSIKVSWSDPKTSSWSESCELAPENSASPLSSVAAVALTEKRLQLFWVGEKGELNTLVHGAGGIKQGWDKDFVKVTSGAAVQSRIAAVARKSTTIDIFFVTPSGAIKHWVYTTGLRGGWEEDKWFTFYFSRELDNRETEKDYTLSIARLDSDIKAISVKDDRIDVYWIGPDNSIRSTRGIKDSTSWKWTPSWIVDSGQAMPGSPLGVHRVGDKVTVSFRSHLGETYLADNAK